MESMSETWREMTRPEVYFSWKATGSRWKCANRRQRSSSTTLPPSRPMPLMKARVVTAWTATATANAPTVTASGTMSWLRVSAGIWSTPRPTSHGPARMATLARTMRTRMATTWTRCGPSRSRSSRRERWRRNEDRPGETSSASSAAMPRQASAGDWLIGALPRSGRARRSSGPGTARSVASSSRWVPTAAITPPDSSATRSASSTVDGRWATTSAVDMVSTSPSARGRPWPRCARRARTAGRRAAARAAGQDGPGQRDALALAAGQGHALLADPGVQAPGQVVHEVGLGRGQRGPDRRPRWRRACRADVLADAGREQGRVLERAGDPGAQRGQRQVAHVGAVQRDGAAGHVGEPRRRAAAAWSCRSRWRRPARRSRRAPAPG